MRISVSGTPGTGKTTISELLSHHLEYELIQVNDYARENNMIIERDDDRDSDIVDIEKLKEVDFPDNVIIEGHLAHFANVDICVVLRTEPDKLKSRMETRDWPKEKVNENFEAEIMGICSVEAREHNETTVDFETTDKTPEKNAEILANIIKSQRFETDPIDWEMEHYL